MLAFFQRLIPRLFAATLFLLTFLGFGGRELSWRVLCCTQRFDESWLRELTLSTPKSIAVDSHSVSERVTMDPLNVERWEKAVVRNS